MLQFNINVPSSVYAKYYFDLRALADAHDLSFPLEPLSKERAAKLEVIVTGSFVYNCLKCHLIFQNKSFPFIFNILCEFICENEQNSLFQLIA